MSLVGILPPACVHQGQRANDALPGIEVFRRYVLGSQPLGKIELRLDCRHHLAADFLLYREGVGYVAVVLFGPNVMIEDPVGKLDGDAGTPGNRADAASQHIPRGEPARDLPRADGAALQGK